MEIEVKPPENLIEFRNLKEGDVFGFPEENYYMRIPEIRDSANKMNINSICLNTGDPYSFKADTLIKRLRAKMVIEL